MKHFFRTITVVSIMGLAACAQADPGDMSTAEIEEIVRSYLLDNPEVIRDALIALQAKDAQSEAQDSLDAIADLSDQIFKDPRDYSIGPRDAKVQLVEFFDYNCGFCKRSTEWIQETMAKHPDDVRIVFKELPVLTGREGTSYMASRAALAAARQGKYRKMHFAMMDERGLTKARVLQLAKNNGLDADQLERDMKDPAIDRQIEDNLALGNKIPALSGTPFFVVNDKFVSGADMAELQDLLDEALAG